MKYNKSLFRQTLLNFLNLTKNCHNFEKNKNAQLANVFSTSCFGTLWLVLMVSVT